MEEHEKLAEKLGARLVELTRRAGAIEDDLRQPLDADWSEQAIDLSDDETLAGVDEVLRVEIRDIRHALLRIENGTYGICVVCGGKIGAARLDALPTATRCIGCA
ncbi:TraR/DksA family transcriptional regulator [Novosphingobium sp.]|uniref:TraR/DksA family transcriptional regulator n=1 Tax=Novosphingobium sp. TaxID=1874826 RepID=UPI0025F13228|nr:TraR/DksA family transcriptional regulator [Novosphingobium sp.]